MKERQNLRPPLRLKRHRIDCHSGPAGPLARCRRMRTCAERPGVRIPFIVIHRPESSRRLAEVPCAQIVEAQVWVVLLARIEVHVRRGARLAEDVPESVVVQRPCQFRYSGMESSKLARGQIGNSGPKPLSSLRKLPAGNCSLSPIAGQVGRGRKTLGSAA